MDLVDLIQEKRFIGQEFLTWLWWKSEERGGSVLVPGRGDATVVFEKHMLLEYGEGETCEKLICSGLQAEMKEARTGLKMAKKIEQARIRLVMGELEWLFTMAGSMMEFRNVKIPKTVKSDVTSDENQEETEGMILERIFLFEELVKIVDDLFKHFMQKRVSTGWQQEVAKVRDWVRQGELVD